MPRHAITNFSRGEFGPALYGRVDIPQYSAGAKQVRNFIIQRYGGAEFRPGFRFVGEVDDAEKIHRYIPFIYSIDQAYVLALEDEEMRVLANGGFVTEDNLKIISVQTGPTTVLEVPYHDMAVGDRIYIDGVSGMDELNGRFEKVIGVPDANHIEIGVSSVGFTAFIMSDGDTRLAPPVAPPPPEPPPAAPPPPSAPPTTGGPGVPAGSAPGTGTYTPPRISPRDHTVYP
jgi:hypothetical protein